MNENSKRPLGLGDVNMARYSRQVIYEHMGEQAQRRLLASRVTLVGCGGLGSVLADTLVRAGVGFLRIVDRDYVELSNLQRQVLFTEGDAAAGLPKAIAAAEHLHAVNAGVTVEPVVADVNSTNVESFIKGADLLLEGTDNLETRFLLNDAAVKHRIPWVYGACVGADGMVMPILAGATPCLRCIWEGPPPAGSTLTCDTVGILAPVVHVVASLQAVAALQILTGQLAALNRRLVQVNVWNGRFEQVDLQSAYDQGDCPCCKHGIYEYLDRCPGARATALCGRRAVQVGGDPDSTIDFQDIAARVRPVAKSAPRMNRYLMRFEVESYQITLFKDGRAIIQGTIAPDVARSIYAKYIGH